jgi:HAE1 family hydrophobic/amphiphilic exporter-1
MNPLRLFILRPIATCLIMVGILAFGVLGYFQLPVSDLPNVDFPTITVSASLPGANPDTVSASMATPLEEQFSTIAGLSSMTSTSSLGGVSIALQFDLSRNIDAAAQDVQAAISTALRTLPPNMPTPPSMRKVNPADSPIYYMAVGSDTLPLSQVNEIADKMVSQRLSMVNGVAQVTVYGAQKFAVRVRPNPLMLVARNLGLDELITAVKNGSSNLPLGNLFTPQKTYTFKDVAQPQKAAEYARLPVAYRNNAPLYLGDLASVIDSVENTRSASWLNGKRSVTLAIQKQPGSNTLKVIDDIKAALPSIESDMPAGAKLALVFDRSTSIRGAVQDIQFTLLLTVALVVGVIYLFLGNVSATWIAALALPMAIVGTFALMAPLGFSLDNLSLMALTLCVGFVIDDAIVVLENISRYREEGASPMEAAFKGTSEITFTVLSMTLSLVAVFIPILFMGGLLGRLFNEFAVTMTLAILVSGFISLTLTPMLCSRFLQKTPERNNFVIRASLKCFSIIENLYKSTLDIVMNFQLLTLIAFFILCGVTVFLFGITPKGFIPTEDSGQISASTEAAQGVPFDEMVATNRRAARIIQNEPGIQSVMISVDNSNAGRFMITLKPARERRKAEEIIRTLRPKLSRVAGLQTFMSLPASIRLGGRSSKAAYQYTLQSPDTVALYQAGGEMEKRMASIPGMVDVTSDLQIKNPEIHLAINEAKLGPLGLTRQQVESAMSSAFSSQQISTIYSPNNDYQVIMELPPELQNDLDALNLVYLRSSNNTANTGSSGSNNAFNRGALIPLGTVLTANRAAGPLSINHQGQFPATTISFNLQPGYALSQVMPPTLKLAEQVLPSNVHASFQGTAQAFNDSFSGLGWLLLVAVLVIYIVLGILYESFIHPITILSGLPPAGLGALLTLNLLGQELNIYGFLGLIMLIGIVKKNAIMMIDFAVESQRKHQTAPEKAIVEAAHVRFRPIMMTTLAALMGTFPIAIGFGEGVEARRSLGWAVFGGLLVSQLITLYITPVLYLYMERIKNYFSKPKGGNDGPHKDPQTLVTSGGPVG